MSKTDKTLVITGGHHTSALTLAARLRAGGWNVVWFGHRHSIWGDTQDSAEYQEVSASGIKFCDLKAGKLYRSFNPLKLIRIPWGFVQAFYLLITIRPRGIVSFGGYLAVPTVIMGWILNIPSVTHEQTVVAGWANKLISVFVKKVAVSWPTSVRHYPRHKVIFTGLPIHQSLRSALTLASSKKIKANGHGVKTVLVTGGKQGSHAINQVVFSSLNHLLSRYAVIHQTGSTSLNNDAAFAKSLSSPRYRPFTYLSQDLFSKYLSQADVVVSRSGAHAVYHYALLGKRCVLIPLPQSSHNEQEENAQVLATNNQAVILKQSDLTSKNLIQALEKALSLNPRPMNLPTDAVDKLAKLIDSSFN